MDYLRNHCWCSRSHWDGKSFDCQVIISVNSYDVDSKEDWANITHKVKVFSQEALDEHEKAMAYVKDKYPGKYDDEYIARSSKDAGMINITTLKPEVMSWLTDNVPDIKGEKAWCIGSNHYLHNDGCGISIFMQRRRDAMLFIKTWSKWKKPIYYTQYFTDVRKKLNTKTLKYEDR